MTYDALLATSVAMGLSLHKAQHCGGPSGLVHETNGRAIQKMSDVDSTDWFCHSLPPCTFAGHHCDTHTEHQETPLVSQQL